jgi:hypothetical protein
MKKAVLFSVVCLILMSGMAYAQSAKEAVKSLKRIEARADMGINYNEYVLAVADARVEVQMFLESAEAKQKQSLTNMIKKILEHYERVREVWKLKVSKVEDLGTVFGHLICLRDDPEGAFGRRLLKQYPEANRSVDNKGALIVRSNKMEGCDEILVDNLIHIIWKEASRDLQQATRMLF